MEELTTMKKLPEYKSISMESIQDGTAFDINNKPRKEEIYKNVFSNTPERPAEMVVYDEIEIKEEPIEYNETTEIQDDIIDNELVPSNDNIQIKDNEFIQFYKENNKIGNSIEINNIKNKDVTDISKNKSNHYFTEKTQCIIPLGNGFTQFTKGNISTQTSRFRDSQTINQPVKTEPLSTETSKDCLGNTEISKGNREDLIAQAVNSVLSSLKNPKPNVLTQLETSDVGSTIQHPSDTLRNMYALHSNNSKSVNQRPNRNSKESAKILISDSLIEECDLQPKRKKIKIHKQKHANDQIKLKTSGTYEHAKETACGVQKHNKNNKSQFQVLKIKVEPQSSEISDKEEFCWNWETNIHNYERQDFHSPEHKNEFSVSGDIGVNETNINMISEKVVPIKKNKKEDSYCEDSLNIRNNNENDYMETYSIKPKGKTRRKWMPGEDGMYACDLCSYKARRPPYLKRHMLTHAIDKPYPCHICNKSLCSYNALKMHLEMHNGIKNYHCSFCDTPFRQKVHLKTHLSKHHKGSDKQPNQCLNINKEPQISETLDIDDSTINSEVEKNDSSMQNESKKSDTKALKIISNDEYSKDLELNKSRTPSCLFTNSSKDPLNDSLMSNTDLEVNSTLQNVNKSPGINDRLSKVKHMSDSLRKKSGSLKKTYTCHICNKILCSYTGLKMHLDIHNGIKKFGCSVCDQSFRQKVHLKVHISKHHNESIKETNQYLNINAEPKISKSLDLDDSNLTPGIDKNNSLMKNESEIQDTKALKAFSNNTCFKDVAINNSRSSSNLFTDSSIDHFGDPLMVVNDLEVNNTIQNINKSSGINNEISKERLMNDSLQKESDSLTKKKCLKANESAESGWNWQTNLNDYVIPDCHSSEVKDKLCIPVENDVQIYDINKESEQNFPIENIKKKNISCENIVDKESIKESKYVKAYKRKPVGKKVKRRRKNKRWTPGEDGLYACNLCSYKAKKAPYLKRHMITHTNEKPYKCHICVKRFNHFNSLKYHLDVHNDIIHDIRKYPCPVCEYSFIQKGHLKSHLLQHSSEEINQCENNKQQKQDSKIKEDSKKLEIDKNNFYMEPTSETHYEQLLKANSNGDCSKVTELKETRSAEKVLRDSTIESIDDPPMINHKLDAFNISPKHNNDLLTESTCEKSNEMKEYGLKSQTNIDNRQNYHLQEYNIKISISTETQKTYIKKKKKKDISTEDIHVENIKKENSSSEDTINKVNEIVSDYKEAISIKRKKKKVYRWIAGEDGMFACNLCSYKAKQAPYLKRHLITHLVDKPYKCHICVKSFCSYNSLKMHLDMHNGVKNYHCSLCDYSFIQKVHLKTHMMSHTGEKKFQCQYCEKKFSRRDHLRTHVVIHSDERPFACDECDLKFKNKSNLYHHKRNHRNDRKYKCQECDAAFMLSNTLRGHLASHLVYRRGCKVCPQCPLFFWSPSQFISHLSKRHDYSMDEAEQILKKFISETNFRFYRKNKKKKKMISKELKKNVKSAFSINNEISIKAEIHIDNEESCPAIDNVKILDGSKESEVNGNKGRTGIGLELLSNMDMNQPIVTCTNRQVFRCSANSQFLVISYNTNPNEESNKTEYFKLVKEDQGGLNIGDILNRCKSYHDIETKIISGDENFNC